MQKPIQQTPQEKCKPNGEGGKNCYPFEKYDANEALKRMKGCCRPCTENFVRELSFLELPEHVASQATARYHKWSTHHRLKASLAADKTIVPLSFLQKSAHGFNPSLAAGLVGATLGVGGSKLSGGEIYNLLPCCHVCVEEFYAPSDFDDLSAFLEFEEKKQARPEVPTASEGSDFRFKVEQTTVLERNSQRKSGKGGKGGPTITKPDVPPKEEPAAQAQVSKNIDGDDQCCKICPGDRVPSVGFDKLLPKLPKVSFLETMEGKKKGMPTCCPVCPSIYSMANGGTEPFGGPFGEGTANMAQAMTEAIQSICACYPNCEASVVETQVGCRPKDIKTSLSSFLQLNDDNNQMKFR
jgi:hypothetical protein|eukprot:Stramenopile-MAST_4_protein_797